MIVNGYKIEPGADLYAANLSGADLSWANLSGANLSRAINIPPLPHTIIVGEGVLRVYKRVATPSGPGIAILEIPAHALRSNGTGRKCRASEARVLECPDEAYSVYAPSFKYIQGSIIKPTEPFDTNRWKECASGIHFFLTREEAEAY